MLRILVLALALCWVGSPARADDANKQAAKAHVAAGDTHYKLGRFAEALVEYTKAFELVPAPPLLFNIGQCHRALKEWEKAIFAYERYLRADPAAKNKKLVEDLILEARAELDKQRAAQAEEAVRAREAAARREQEEAQLRAQDAAARRAEEQRARQAARQAELERQRRVETARLEAERERAGRPFYRRTWFWAVVGGAAAAAAAGGTIYYFSGDTTVVDPSGSLGGLDRR